MLVYLQILINYYMMIIITDFIFIYPTIKNSNNQLFNQPFKFN